MELSVFIYLLQIPFVCHLFPSSTVKYHMYCY